MKRHYFEVIVCIALLFFIIPLKIGDQDRVEAHFHTYLQNLNRSYNDTIYQQKLHAFKIIDSSLKTIEELNLNQTNMTAKYGPTKFSDMHPDEFLKINLVPDMPNQLRNIFLLPDLFKTHPEDLEKIKKAAVQIKMPLKLDWRNKNVVTNPINQHTCSGCWAFSGIGMIESLNAIRTGKLEKLSIQQAIDCNIYSDGCNGGNTCAFMHWMKADRVKIVREYQYPLKLTNGECKNLTTDGVQINRFECINLVGSEIIMLTLLAQNGPLAVAVNALTWQNYIGGVIQFHCEESPLKN
ncbi:hypothetical protein NQ317_001412 [Molorchus minor]|uniref:Uncharacterized protein n=1 Tax=Molorchus minor TaxID=1323400 RepID=A0ABQ9K054_9CUCU|nr:hypothetical protein NQ317_001412 [Molorchus minor]